MSFSHTSTLACSFVSPRPDAVDEHPHAEASGGSLTRLTLGPGDRLDVGFSSPCLSKKGRRALGRLRGTDLGKIDRRLQRVVHEIRQQELRSQRGRLDDVGVGPPGVLRGVGHPAARLDEGLRERHRSLPLRVA